MIIAEPKHTNKDSTVEIIRVGGFFFYCAKTSMFSRGADPKVLYSKCIISRLIITEKVPNGGDGDTM